jgi:hypothetical protein
VRLSAKLLALGKDPDSCSVPQQYCISFSAAVVIFGGQEEAAENKRRISAASDTAAENSLIFGGLRPGRRKLGI